MPAKGDLENREPACNGQAGQGGSRQELRTLCEAWGSY